MTFEVEVNGRARTVSIERAGCEAGRFRVSVDGTSMMVDAQRVGEFGVSLVFPEASHESGAVHLVPGPVRGELLAHVAGRAVPVLLNGRRTPSARAEGAGRHGESKVVAPMPGRIVRVLVSAGEEVRPHQPVIVIEAMKMENELRSPRGGRVREVAVAAGSSVDAGRVLVVIE